MSDADVFKDRNLHEDEEVIEKTINYLKYHDSNNANRNYAVGFLKFMERFAFHAEKVGDLNYDDFLEKYKASLKNS